MKLKSFFQTLTGAGFVCFVAMATSCNKHDDNSTPVNKDSVYLPVAIYNSGEVLDSFVYNDNNTLSAVYATTSRKRMQIAYNEAGRCKQIAWYSTVDNELDYVDSIIYNTNGENVFLRRFPGAEFQAALRVKLNSEGSVSSLSRDTVYNSNSWNKLRFDMTISGGNLTQYVSAYSNGVTGEQPSEHTTKVKLTYDQYPNSLRAFFLKNPWMQVVLGYYQSEILLYTASTNNITGFFVEASSGSTQDSPAVNTYDEETGLLVKQMFMLGGNELTTYRFSWKKVAAK